jgi:hypothetical protein
MNKLLFLALFFSFSAFAQDMSRTEGSDVWVEAGDGTIWYDGKCSLHEDYEDVHFEVKKTLVPYFETFKLSKKEIRSQLKDLDPALVAAASKRIGGGITNTDDITVEKIDSLSFDGLDLFRFNVGIGGGNGVFIVFNKTRKGYELMSQVMDSDIEYCDKKVWLK